MPKYRGNFPKAVRSVSYSRKDGLRVTTMDGSRFHVLPGNIPAAANCIPNPGAACPAWVQQHPLQAPAA